MLSRRTVLAVARLAAACFELTTFPNAGLVARLHVRTDLFADLLFKKDHDLTLIGAARAIDQRAGAIKDFVLQIYTGPTLELLIMANEPAASHIPSIQRNELAAAFRDQIASS